jgi:hypothetical protein
MKTSQLNKRILMRRIAMKVKRDAMAGIAMLLLAGCETPPPAAQAPVTVPTRPEVTIQAPANKVRAAANKIMVERGYQVTSAAADTLLFDRTAELGASAKYGFMYGKEAWRRVRMTLAPAGAATRVTARPALLINRGNAFEREEVDTSEGARNLMQQILEKIRDQAQAVR